MSEVRNYMFLPPWETEPNEVEFLISGLRALIRRNEELGTLCGYLQIPKGHPWYQVSYIASCVTVHGGITFSGVIDNDWFIGFDCAHAGDFVPGFSDVYPDGVYRDMEFVVNQLHKLADQVRLVGPSA